ncbi:MAG TPA: hypothetical protein PLF11_07720, partial [Bacillota bacterium]|nr:hypothetical protein [Bacillota bacterium]
AACGRPEIVGRMVLDKRTSDVTVVAVAGPKGPLRNTQAFRGESWQNIDSMKNESRFNVAVKSGGSTVILLRGAKLDAAVAEAKAQAKYRRSKVYIINQDTSATDVFDPPKLES